MVFNFVASSSGQSVTGSEIGPLIDLGLIGGVSHGFPQYFQRKLDKQAFTQLFGAWLQKSTDAAVKA
jgi:hypothetical protein